MSHETIKKISLVIPVYNEEGSIKILTSKIQEILSSLSYEYEILFINDGSTDKSGDIIANLVEQDENLKMIEMRKNFGKSEALSCGFNETSGDIVFTMDADLQDDPEEIPRMIEQINQGYDLVSGWKKDRKDPLTKIISSKIFNAVTSTISGIKLHDFNCGFKAYRKEVVKNIEVYGELHRFLPALAHQKGFKVGEIPIKHHERKYGTSKYGRLGLRRLSNFLLDPINVVLLTRYTKKPMHFFGLAGLFSFFIGLAIGSYLTVLKFVTGSFQGHYPLLMLVMLLILVGIQFTSLGLIAEMISGIGYRSADDEGKIKRKLIKK